LDKRLQVHIFNFESANYNPVKGCKFAPLQVIRIRK